MLRFRSLKVNAWILHTLAEKKVCSHIQVVVYLIEK